MASALCQLACEKRLEARSLPYGTDAFALLAEDYARARTLAVRPVRPHGRELSSMLIDTYRAECWKRFA